MKKPKIIAHRGFWNTEDTIENTIKSLKQAQQLPIYGCEFDVRMSVDGVPLIYHDEFLAGLEVSKTEYKTLFSAFKTSCGGFLPTLELFLTYGMKTPSQKLIMEVKDLSSKNEEKNLVESVIYLVEKLRMQDRIEYISFSKYICQLLKEWLPKVNIAYLKGDLTPKEIKDLGLTGLNYENFVLKQQPEWISEASELGLTTACWTVNDPNEFFEFAEMGIDFITTDRPDLFLDLLSEFD